MARIVSSYTITVWKPKNNEWFRMDLSMMPADIKSTINNHFLGGDTQFRFKKKFRKINFNKANKL